MKKTALALVTASLISGCGGGGSDSENLSRPPTTSPSTTTYTYTAVSTNSCGMTAPQSDAVMLVHNDDFSTREVIRADSNGEMALTVTDGDTVNVSVFTTSQYGEQPATLNISTYVDADPDAIRKNFVNAGLEDALCECANITLSIQNPEITNDQVEVIVNDNFVFQPWSTDTSSLEYATEVCRAPDGNWPAIPAMIRDAGNVYSGILTEYETSGTNVFPVTDLAEPVLVSQGPVSLPDISLNNFVSIGFREGTPLLQESINSDNYDAAFYFTSPALEAVSLTNVVASYDIEINDPDINTVNVWSNSQRLFNEQPASTVDFNHLDFSSVSAEFENSANLESFDFSGSGAQAVSLTTFFNDEAGSPVLTWQINTPASASFAALDNINLEDSQHVMLDQMSGPLSDEVYFSLGIYRFNGASNFSEALQALESADYRQWSGSVTGMDSITAGFLMNAE